MLGTLYWRCINFLGAVFDGVMVFGGFLVWVSVGFCSVFCAFGCCEVLFLYWGVGWFGGLVFIGFLGFCRVLPVCTVSILRVFIFFGVWLTVQQ